MANHPSHHKSMKEDKRKDPLRRTTGSLEEFGRNEFTKDYYKIQDVAEFVGVPQSTIRFWEKLFDEVKPIRSVGNVRYYTPEVIELLRMIHYLLKIKGLRIDAAKEQLRINRKNISRRVDAIRGLEDVKKDLTALLKSMSKR